MHSPEVVSREEWLVARKAHLKNEKALTRMRDLVAAERRTLPWVKVDKTYAFEGPHGKRTLAELFDGRSQLAIYHFMWRWDLDAGCPSAHSWPITSTAPICIWRTTTSAWWSFRARRQQSSSRT